MLGHARRVREGVLSLTQTARQALLGPSSVRHALMGAIAVIQRTDSALRLDVHVHVLVLDGVYVRDATTRTLEFHPLPTPTTAKVADIAKRTAQRLDGLLRAQGRSLLLDGYTYPNPPVLQLDHPALAACYDAASRGLASVTVRSERCAKAGGGGDATTRHLRKHGPALADARAVGGRARRVNAGSYSWEGKVRYRGREQSSAAVCSLA